MEKTTTTTTTTWVVFPIPGGSESSENSTHVQFGI